MIEKAYFYKKTLEKLSSAELESKAPVYTEEKDTQYNRLLHCASYKESLNFIRKIFHICRVVRKGIYLTASLCRGFWQKPMK